MCKPNLSLVSFLAVSLLGLTPSAHAITINGFTAAANNRWAATPTDPLTGPFTPNTNPAFIALGYDLSGYGWQSTSSSYKDLGVTLISPQHMAQAKHVQWGWTNATYTFANRDNVLVSRSIGGTLNKLDINLTDVRALRLDAPFTPADKVSPFRILDNGPVTNAVGKTVLLTGHDGSSSNYQRRFAYSQILFAENSYVVMTKSNLTAGWVSNYDIGDSGNPTFTIYDNKLTFQGAHYTRGTYLNDPNWADAFIYPQVNAFMAGDGYALRWTIDEGFARIWTGTTNGTFGTTSNWTANNPPDATHSAVLDGATTSNRTLNLASATTTRGILVKAATGTNPFTFTGSTLTLMESGVRNEDVDTLTLNTPITLGGSQNWEAASGPLTLGGNIATGGFLLALSGDQAITVGSGVVISGSGSVAWDNPGTWTPPAGQLGFSGKFFVQRGTVNLTTANTYAGTTTVTGGTLLANNSTGSATGPAAVTLSNDARLGGSGTITGAVTFRNTSGLVANLTTAPGSHAKLNLSGALALGTTSSFTITATGGATTGTYTLVTAAGGITGALPTLVLPANWSATTQISGNNLNLVVTSLVPTAPTLLAGQTVSATVNTAFSYQIAAIQNPTSFALTGSVLPPGVTLNTSTGLLSGTPTATGIYSPVFTATNALGTSPAVTITILIAAPVTAIISESFNYDIGLNNPDPDAGLNNGNGLPATNSGGNPSGTSTGLRATWGASTDVAAGLTYTQGSKVLVTSGGAGRVNNATWGATTPPIYRFMTTDPFLAQRIGGGNNSNFGVNGTSLYFSLLAQTSSATDSAFRLSFRYDGSQNFFLNNTATGWSLNGTNATGASLALNTPTLLVLRFDFAAGAATTISLWVNPTLGSPLGTANATVLGATFPGFSNFQTRAAVANAMTFDEVRMGTTLESVTPFHVIPTIPVVTVSQSAIGTVSSAFSYQVVASNSPTSYALASGSLPAGVSLNTTTGLLSGTPTASGTFTPSITATNSGGTSPGVTVTLTIAPAPTGLTSFRTANGLAPDGTQDTLTPAGDGVQNLLKYAFNMLGSGTGQAADLTTPNASVLAPDGTAGLPLVGIESSTGKLQLTYIHRKASATPAPGITYAVEFSDDLVSWAVDPAATATVTDLDTTFERVTVTHSAQNPIPAKRFARVKVSSP